MHGSEFFFSKQHSTYFQCILVSVHYLPQRTSFFFFFSCCCLKRKVKFTLVQALRLCTGCTAHSGSRGIALLFLDHGTRRGEGSASRPDRSLSPGKTRYPLYRRLGGLPGPVWTGAENLSPHRDSIRGPSSP